MNIFVSTDQQFLDLSWTGMTLREQHWGAWLKQPRLEAAIKESLCFGAYIKPLEGDFLRPKQVGFARVITDKHTFSSVMDVVVDSRYRKQGIGTRLIDCILAHEDVKRTVAVLGTMDAGLFYEKFGFGPVRGYMLQKDPLHI